MASISQQPTKTVTIPEAYCIVYRLKSPAPGFILPGETAPAEDTWKLLVNFGIAPDQVGRALRRCRDIVGPDYELRAAITDSYEYSAEVAALNMEPEQVVPAAAAEEVNQ